jgi:predicted enzyme involved in methoxymalonyl-ACP biosynthesis
MSGRKNCHVYTVKVKDCFCDYGIVGLMILKESSPEVAIDTFLLSCRIIGRGIEAALLDRIKSAYRKKGFKRIKGAYIKTEKNAVSADLYDRNGFKPLSRGRNGNADYCCDLGGKIKASRFSKLINIKA